MNRSNWHSCSKAALALGPKATGFVGVPIRLDKQGVVQCLMAIFSALPIFAVRDAGSR
jgi:hypothetical protein